MIAYICFFCFIPISVVQSDSATKIGLAILERQPSNYSSQSVKRAAFRVPIYRRGQPTVSYARDWM
ncbi:unnamed protein product, partial [Allacma fusca]